MQTLPALRSSVLAQRPLKPFQVLLAELSLSASCVRHGLCTPLLTLGPGFQPSAFSGFKSAVWFPPLIDAKLELF